MSTHASSESARLQALNSFRIVDTLPEQDYEDLTQLAASICQTPIALISLVDEKRQWFKSARGITLQETSRDLSFCAHAILTPDQPFIVADARLDERFESNDLVTGDPHLVFYAGAPLVDKEGNALGSLCVIDRQTRELTADQLSSLQILSRQVMRLLELRKKSYQLEQSQQLYEQENIALQRSQKRFETVFDHAPIGLGLLSGEDHVFELANDRIAEMAGRTSQEMQGKPLLEALPELSRQGLKEIFDQVRHTKKRFVAPEIPIQLVRAGKMETAYFYASFEPVLEADGKISIVDFSLEITDQILAQRALKASEERFRTLIENSPFALGLYEGPDLVIALANEAILSMWGKTKAVIGQKIVEALPELTGQPFIPLLEQVYRTGIAYKSTEQAADLMVNGTLQRFYFNFVYQPLFNEQGKVYAILNSAIDVTERYRAREKLSESEQRYRELAAELEQRVSQRTQELEKANQDLRRSNDHLQQFAFVASHDLQEPLRKIQTFGSLLETRLGNNPDEKTSHLIQRINLASLRMSTLITDLLNYSRLATEERNFEWVSLDDVLISALDTLSLVIRERKAQITVQELGNLKGNFTQLHQLFQNLLSNAIKFTPFDQQPIIQITHQLISGSQLPVQMTPEANSFHQISISDQGTGFEEKFAEKIFMVFQRLHDQKEYPGTGIGLAICRRVVENHGGLLTAQSQFGTGSTFTVYLPVR